MMLGIFYGAHFNENKKSKGPRLLQCWDVSLKWQLILFTPVIIVNNYTLVGEGGGVIIHVDWGGGGCYTECF